MKVIDKKKFKIENEDAIREFGLMLAEKIEPNDVIALNGDLGTGKTTLTKYIAEGLGIKETISSPTFTIVKEYRTGRVPLFHFDLYRIGDEEEFEDIGLDEFLFAGGVCVIEWPDAAAGVLPENAIAVNITYGATEQERNICIS